MLRFDSYGQFRILIISDIQEWKIPEERYSRYIEKIVQANKPDMAILLGDMLFGPLVWTHRRTEVLIGSIVKLLERYHLPFAFVLGNHDMDSFVPVTQQVDLYRRSSLCITPKISERRCPGAYSIDIRDTNDNAVIRLLMMDSGATRITLSGIQYIPIDNEQLKFTKSLLSDQECPPVFVFQHIPVPEIYSLLKSVPPEVPGAVHGHGSDRNRYFVLKDNADGTLGEAPCPPGENVGQFDEWIQSGKVRAAVFGHDHKNSFVRSLDGVTLIQTSCAGLNCYGREDIRGCRMLSISSDGSFNTSPIYYQDLEKREKSE